jgi:2-polyprenyl-6-methoxyphenol hydroxylase-like FAD-dependent oxidoreductase
VGDAAHPLSSFTSQGVSSAIEDAVVLAGEIGAGATSHEGLGRALARYSSERREQCAPYIDKGRALNRSFLAPLDVKNLVMPLA